MNTAEYYETERNEMGWNDVIGNLRRAVDASDEQKRDWAQLVVDGRINLPACDDAYIAGTIAAAKSFLDGDPTPFKGPEDIIAYMEAMCPS